MSAVIKWNTSASRQVTTIARPKWREVRQGLILALVGLPLVILLALPGLYLLALPEGLLASRLKLSNDAASLLGLVLLVAGLLGDLALIAGYWRCLLFAPQGHGAKDLQFACLLCSLVAPVCFGLAHCLGGDATFAALEAGPRKLLELDLLRPAPLLQLMGVVACLAAVLLFSGYARAICRCLGDADGTRGITYYFWLVAFLVGATGGLLIQTGRATPPNVIGGLGVAWLLCLLWHLLLINGAVGRVGRVLRGERLGQPAPKDAPQPGSGQVVLEAAAYLPHWK